jgi:hypothetical protein
MLMVIFGAGASFDSSPTYGINEEPPGSNADDRHNAYNRLPLAKDLFANRPLFINILDRFPQCKAIVPRLRDQAVLTGEKSIEALLKEIEDEAVNYPPAKRELAAVQCYLQSAIWNCEHRWKAVTRGITNYLTLLREVRRTRKAEEPVLLVTFNYDTLLEDALEQLGFEVRSMSDYFSGRGPFILFKPHGSINWVREVDSDVPANVDHRDQLALQSYMIENAGELKISDRFVFCIPDFIANANGSGRPSFPAIAIPVEKKQVFQCPTQMIDEVAKLLPTVTRVLIIGWRGTEEHFLNLLKGHLKPSAVSGCIVAGDHTGAEETKRNIYRALKTNALVPNPRLEHAGFTQFILGRQLEQWLAPSEPWYR